MSSTTQVILLERVEKLGELGDIVNVKPGFARNYLLPQKKALRASKENIAYFEAQKKVLQEQNDKLRADAEKLAKKIDGLKVAVIRQASEAGQLFGSVTTRDIAQAVSEEAKETVTRQMVELNQNIKMIGLIPVAIVLHPEVKAEVVVNIARSKEEAKTQAKTGRALIAEEAQEEPTLEEKAIEKVEAEEAKEAEEEAKQAEAEAVEKSKDAPAEGESSEEKPAKKKASKKDTKAKEKAPAEEKAGDAEAPAEEDASKDAKKEDKKEKKAK